MIALAVGEKRTRRDGPLSRLGGDGGLKSPSKASESKSLTSKERELCESLPIQQSHYLAIKEALIRDAVQQGIITPEGVQRSQKLEDPKREMILDFLIKEVLPSR